MSPIMLESTVLTWHAVLMIPINLSSLWAISPFKLCFIMCKWGNEPYFMLRWIFMTMSPGRGTDPWIGEGTFPMRWFQWGLISDSYRLAHPRCDAYPGSIRPCWRPPAHILAAWLSAFPIGSHSGMIHTRSPRILKYRGGNRAKGIYYP